MHADRELVLPPSRRRLLLVVGVHVWLALLIRVAGREVLALRVPGDAVPVVRPVLLDPERARLAEWRLLDGVGPERARAIVLERLRGGPFRAAADLQRVPGIGADTAARIAPFLRWGGPAAGGPR